MVKMLIDGALVDGPRTMQVIDPSDETIAAEVPDATTADVDRAFAAAAKAFPAWRDSSPEARGAVLTAMANVIIENADELADLLIQETGRPMALAQFELLHLAVGYLSHYAELRLETELIVDEDTRRVALHRKPLGVVAAVVPWNAPVFIACIKISPALLSGTTIDVKAYHYLPYTSHT